jgi:hypothetical protein
MVKSEKNKKAGAWMTPVSATVVQSVPASVTPVASVTGPIQQSPPPMLMQPQSAGDPITSTIMAVNSNPYLIGIFMLLLNLGGRFLSLELTKKQEALLQQPWIRPLIFFTVIFMATRNVVAAFWVTILFFFIIWVVANENSPFCMIPSWCGHNIEEQKQTYLDNIQHLQSN